MFLGEENSISFSQLIGKMAKTSNATKASVFVQYSKDGWVTKTTPGVFISETVIIAYAEGLKTSTSATDTAETSTSRTITSQDVEIIRQNKKCITIEDISITNSIAKIIVSYLFQIKILLHSQIVKCRIL